MNFKVGNIYVHHDNSDYRDIISPKYALVLESFEESSKCWILTEKGEVLQ